MIFLLPLALPSLLKAQTQKEKPTVTFEQMYDEPYSINKLFIGFQPLYGEVFATNVNAGFGVEGSYFYKDKFDLKAHFRKTYSSEFFDQNRNASIKNQDSYSTVGSVSDKPQAYNYYEFGGTYHVKDFDQDSKTKMTLFKKSFKGDRWSSMVPFQADNIPCKVRKIYGARLGAIIWNSTTDLSRALSKQQLTNAALTTSAGKPLIDTYTQNGQSRTLNVFGNVRSANIYVGGSMTWIRNVAVSFDKYDDSVDDGIMTVFFDIMFAPAYSVDAVTYQGEQYLTKALKTHPVGFRAGIDGKFNRTLGWSYGGELGYRPSLVGMGFFAMFKIAFPLYSTNLDNKVESFGK
ncbi:MAG: hypothetical protein HY015_09475 [Bacteroidetes bacterium]|nr:hypothetical protein [Bacteroidota bacterium]MBI3483185.1 hypothetical protein [Bacteroidota bacterium]